MSEKILQANSLPLRLWILFFTFAKIATIVVGGGLAMLPVIEEVFVNRKKLITREELLDMITLTQTVPGLIVANASVYIGLKVAGFIGAVVALTGAILPSFIIILGIAWFFPHLSPENPWLLGVFAGVRAGVTGLIAVTAWKLAVKSIVGKFEALSAALFLIGAFYVHPALIILAGMALGVIYILITGRRLGEKKSTEVKK